MIAEKTFDHHGTRLEPGDVFTATPIEAAALTYAHRAIFAPGASTASDREAPKKKKKRSRRTYKRRDLEAEA